MCSKLCRWGLGIVVVVWLLGMFFFDGELTSYVRTSAKSVKTAVQDQIPLELELERARDMVDQIIPELQANIQIIAREEVEVAHLRKEIEATEKRLASQKHIVASLRDQMTTQQVSFQLNGRQVTRNQLAERLAFNFNNAKQAKLILDSKRRLLQTRERALNAARESLSTTQQQKEKLENQIEALAAQHRLLKAQSVTSQVNIDNSALAQADKLLGQLEKRLETAKRVLAHQSELFDSIPVETEIMEDELMADIDDFLHYENEVAERVADIDLAELD